MTEQFDAKKLQMINQVSPSFCTAKWLQVTVDLINGTTHSCHHPQRHKVPLAELENNPSALHNTIHKKQQRKKMLGGERPSECSYCWDMEDLGNQYSDRYIKTTDSWAWSDFQKISQLNGDENIIPRYLEVMIDNICNFSCAYCMADISSGVAFEMQKYGGYPVSNPHHRLSQSNSNQNHTPDYMIAFEKWLPQILNELRVLRITGGEPLLSKSFWKLLEDLKNYGQNRLELVVNSHLNHQSKIINKFCDTLKNLLDEKKIQTLSIYTSLDTFGTQAEYIRHGLDYNLVLNNIEYMQSQLPNTQFVVMCTFNLLSIAQFDRLLDDIIQLKKSNNVILDISYLKNPEYLRADIATPDLVSQLKGHLQKMKLHTDSFSPHEINKLQNLVQWVESRHESSKEPLRRSDFFRFINEYDRRKKRNFIDLFPEYKDFYIASKQAAFLMSGNPLP